jgi:hypothetical protein
MVTKAAQALKLRHPTNRTNLMAVLRRFQQLDARVRQIKSGLGEVRCTQAYSLAFGAAMRRSASAVESGNVDSALSFLRWRTAKPRHCRDIVRGRFSCPPDPQRGNVDHIRPRAPKACQSFRLMRCIRLQAWQVIASYSLTDVSSSLSSQCWTFIRVIGQVNSRRFGMPLSYQRAKLERHDLAQL